MIRRGETDADFAAYAASWNEVWSDQALERAQMAWIADRLDG